MWVQEGVILHMLSIEEVLKKSNHTIYVVNKRNRFVEYNNCRINVGMYYVIEIPCCTKEELEFEIRNFKRVLEDDDRAMLTCDEARAYLMAAYLNETECSSILDVFNSASNDSMDDTYWIDFENFIISECDDIINKKGDLK